MPIVKAYSGSIRLMASEMMNEAPFYEFKKTVYGETLGELHDSLVAYSVIAAREAERWVLVNKPERYRLTEGYWRLLITLPEIMKCQQKTLPENIDSTFDSRVLAFEEIVIVATVHRDSAIRQAYTQLQLVRGGSTAIPETPAFRMSDLGDCETLEEITECGLDGNDLDTVLQIAVMENRIAAYESHLKYDRRLDALEADGFKFRAKLPADEPRKKILGLF